MEGFLQWLSGKESAYQSRRPPFLPWVGKIPWRRARQPTPVFLPGKSHGQRSLAGYSPWGCKRVRDDLVTEQQQVNRAKPVFGSRETEEEEEEQEEEGTTSPHCLPEPAKQHHPVSPWSVCASTGRQIHGRHSLSPGGEDSDTHIVF